MFNVPGLQSGDIVGIFTSGFQQLFPSARPLRANVVPSSQLMEHPIETGAKIADHRVFNPIEINVVAVLTPEEFTNAYQAIATAYRSEELLIVQTKTGPVENMCLVAIPHDETPQMGDTIAITLKFKEVEFVEAQFEALPPDRVANKKDASTKSRGEQQTTTTPPAKRTSTAAKIADAI